MPVEYQANGETLTYDEWALEDEVRRGLMSADVLVRSPEWTGDVFKPIRDVPQLRDALDAPDARFAAQLRLRRVPWAALLVCLVVCGAGAVQVTATILASTGAIDPDLVERVVAAGALGWSPSVVHGGFWTPWTSQLLHAGAFHVASNLALLGYCGYRAERAMGATGLAIVASAAVALAAPTLIAFSDLPVVGSSILAYAFWTAQITIGFRMGERIPVGWRAYYGFGNFVLFVPLFLSSLGVPGISHLGHAAGAIGGALAAALAPLPTHARAASVRRIQLLDLSIAAALGLLPVVALFALRFLPGVAGWPWTDVANERGGLTMQVPERMTELVGSIGGMRLYGVASGEFEGVYMGVWVLDAPPDDGFAVSTLSPSLGTPVDVPVDERTSRVDGWTTRSWVFPASGRRAVDVRVVDRMRVEGDWVWRVGYVVPADSWLTGPEERLFTAAIDTAAVGEPADVAERRAAHEKDPKDANAAYGYAADLLSFGKTSEAEAAVAPLLTRNDGWEWDACRFLLEDWKRDPSLGQGLTRDIVAARLHEAPVGDDVVLETGSAWLVAHGGCSEVVAEVPRLQDELAASGDASAVDAVEAVITTAQGCSPAVP